MATDFQHREGATASSGIAGIEQSNVDRRERLRRLALETIDLSKDPYFMKNHLGSYECKLCLTLHNNEGSYLAHTQGKKHQANLSRRAAREQAERANITSQYPDAYSSAPKPKRVIVKIGRPGYRVTKLADPNTRSFGLLIQVHYPELTPLFIKPLYRFMSTYEQKLEQPDKQYQYLLIAADPYETIAFKIPSYELDMISGTFLNDWDPDFKQYTLQFFFKNYSKSV